MFSAIASVAPLPGASPTGRTRNELCVSIFDDIIAGIPVQPRLTTPTYKQTSVASPPTTPCYSAPCSFSYKADLNPKKGLVTSYLTVFDDPSTGQRFIDSYLDVIEPGSFSKTIGDLNKARSVKNNPYLCAYLWQHKREELIGGIRALTEDSIGVIYEAQLNMGVQRAREAFALAEEKQIGSSYRYDPVKFANIGDIRHLLEIRLHEVSLVSFPANPHAGILDTKSRYGASTTRLKIDALAEKMNASFDELERQFKRVNSAFPDFDWLKDADEYPGEIGMGITDLLVSIQREMKR